MDKESWLKEVKENAEFRGEVRAFITNAPQAMRSAATGAVENHNKDKDAHGAGVKREIDKKIVGWATVGATVLGCFSGMIGAAIHKLWSHTP